MRAGDSGPSPSRHGRIALAWGCYVTGKRSAVLVCATAVAVAVLGGVWTPQARAKDDLSDILRAIQNEDDPGVRRRKVLELVALDTPKAAGRLGTLVREDPDEGVRITAAQGLGRMEHDTTELLTELVLFGGTLRVRDAVAASLARRGGGPAPLFEIAQDATKHPLERTLAIEALSAFPGADVLQWLERAGRHPETFVRCVALRTLGRHPDGALVLGDSLAETLTTHMDDETVLTALDLASDIADARFRPVADMLDTFLSARVRASVDIARKRLEYAEALERFEAEKVGTYGSKTPPEPPPPRPRLDIVYVLDATGSVCGHIGQLRARIRDEARLLDRVGTDLRAGVVAYRDNDRRWAGQKIEALPPTYDREAVDQFLRDLDARGSDARGTGVHWGLSAALDRVPWRRDVRRQVVLIADGRCNDPERAHAIARTHRLADRTTVHVLYLLRTRVKVPEDIQELATVGGGFVEVLE